MPHSHYRSKLWKNLLWNAEIDHMSNTMNLYYQTNQFSKTFKFEMSFFLCHKHGSFVLFFFHISVNLFMKHKENFVHNGVEA